MIVEHEFVTTLEKDAALALARQFLEHIGLAVTSATGDAVEVASDKKLGARSASRLQQHVRVAFDRGRVQVAVGIIKRGKKLQPVHRSLLMGIAIGLELLLARELPVEVAAAQWAIAENTIQRKRRRTNRLAVGCLAAVLAFLVGMITLVLSV